MKKNLIIIITLVVLVAVAGVLFWNSTRKERKITVQGTPRIIEEHITIPDTREVNEADARLLEQGAVAVPLVPKSEEEKVIIPQAELTLKEGYAAAADAARQWDDAALPVFIKSLGTVTLEGKSSSWQTMFSSPDKENIGYQVILQGKSIVSKKEVGEVIRVLQQPPLYQDASLTAASFHLNPDNKKGYYGILTSKGASTIAV